MTEAHNPQAEMQKLLEELEEEARNGEEILSACCNAPVYQGTQEGPDGEFCGKCHADTFLKGTKIVNDSPAKNLLSYIRILEKEQIVLMNEQTKTYERYLQETKDRDEKLKIAEEALETYKKMEDEQVKLLAGFSAKSDMEMKNSPAAKALSLIRSLQ